MTDTPAAATPITTPPSKPVTWDHDVVVVGGGPAGLSSALMLARSRRSVLVVDAGEPRNAAAAHLHGHLGSDGLPPGELIHRGREEVAAYGGEVRGGRVIRLAPVEQPDGEPRFEVTLGDGSELTTRRLVLATGVRDRLPDVPGLIEGWGRDVVHCPYCHGYEVRDQAIGVLGTGPMAVHQATLFRQLSDQVTLLTHTAPPLTEQQRETLAALDVAVVAGEVAAAERAEGRLVGVRLHRGTRVPLEALAVASLPEVDSALPGQLGLRAQPVPMGDDVLGTAVPAEPTGATSIPGLWVVGNLAAPFAQIVASAAVGAMAGAMANADLVAEDGRRAVARHRTESRGALTPESVAPAG